MTHKGAVTLMLITQLFCSLAKPAALTEAFDPDLLAKGLNELPVEDRERAYAVRVIYDFKRLRQIIHFIESQELSLEDVQPTESGCRLAWVIKARNKKTSKLSDEAVRNQLLQTVENSKLFVSAEIFLERYDPGFFYVYVADQAVKSAAKTFAAWGIKANAWSEEPEESFFQCQVPVGEERFWIARAKKLHFVRKVLLEPEIHYPGTLVIDNLDKADIPMFEKLVRKNGLFIEPRDDVEADEPLRVTVRVPLGKETYYIALFARAGFPLKIFAMADGEATAEVALKNQDSVAMTSVTAYGANQEKMLRTIESFLKQQFDRAVITRSGKTGVKLTSEHRGFKALTNRRASGWEKLDITVIAAPVSDTSWELRVTSRTLASGKGSMTTPPTEDHYERIASPGASAPDLAAEQRFTEKLVDDIARALRN